MLRYIRFNYAFPILYINLYIHLDQMALSCVAILGIRICYVTLDYFLPVLYIHFSIQRQQMALCLYCTTLFSLRGDNKGVIFVFIRCASLLPSPLVRIQCFECATIKLPRPLDILAAPVLHVAFLHTIYTSRH